MDKLKEENKQLSQSRDDEVAKWVDVEQKLAETKLDLAEAQTKVDNKDFCVVVSMYKYMCFILNLHTCLRTYTLQLVHVHL